MSAPLSLVRLGFQGLGRVTPGLMAKVAEHLYFTPRRHLTPPREQPALQDAARFGVATEAGVLCGYEWQRDSVAVFPWEAREPRRTVLLVHGWEGRATQLH